MTPLTATLQTADDADRVWTLITSFAAYESWNRLVPRIEGEPKLNAKLRVTLAPASRRPIRLRARVLVAARNRELRWRGTRRLPGLLTVEHGIRIEQRADGCRLHHVLTAHGWGLTQRLAAALEVAFEDLNRTLLAADARPVTQSPPRLRIVAA